MTHKQKQFAGGTLAHSGSNAEVRADRLNSILVAPKIAMGCSQTNDPGVPELPGRGKLAHYGASTTGNCDTLPAKWRKGESLRAVEIELDVRSWVKNVLIPALVDEFIEENGMVPA